MRSKEQDDRENRLRRAFLAILAILLLTSAILAVISGGWLMTGGCG